MIFWAWVWPVQLINDVFMTKYTLAFVDKIWHLLVWPYSIYFDDVWYMFDHSLSSFRIFGTLTIFGVKVKPRLNTVACFVFIKMYQRLAILTKCNHNNTKCGQEVASCFFRKDHWKATRSTPKLKNHIYFSIYDYMLDDIYQTQIDHVP